MALTATVFKARLSVSDLDRPYYGDHDLVLARHPSETDERMMLRLLAFALNADEHLAFGRGLSNDDEPALWHKDLTGRITHWIEVGLPDDRLLRRACGRSDRVTVYAYGRRAHQWWQGVGEAVAHLDRLKVWHISDTDAQSLQSFSGRGMTLQCTIQDGTVWLSNDERTVEITPLRLDGSDTRAKITAG